MTIPTLINKTNKQELVSKLKKAYSTLSQATNRIIADEGKPRADIGGWATTSEVIFNMYKNYLNGAKDCSLSTNCFEGSYLMLNKTTKNFTSHLAFVMSDGTEVTIWGHNDSCSAYGNGSSGICALIIVDVNGIKKPNIIGQDTFGFVLKQDGLLPQGCDSNACTGSEEGFGCTCKVLREGAINY